MYRCEDCGHLYEYGEDKDNNCPLCGGDAQRVTPCGICGTYTEDDYCQKCSIDVYKRFKAAMEDFTDKEIEFIKELYEVTI